MERHWVVSASEQCLQMPSLFGQAEHQEGLEEICAWLDRQLDLEDLRALETEESEARQDVSDEVCHTIWAMGVTARNNFCPGLWPRTIFSSCLPLLPFPFLGKNLFFFFDVLSAV
jgi:hypothetical protein